MQRRRNPFLVLALFACLMQCQNGHTQVASWPPGPVDSGAEFRDDVPDPAPLVPTPAPEAPELDTPVVVVPAEPVPVFDPIAIGLDFTPATGSRVKVTWVHGDYQTREFAGDRFYVWAKPGTHTGTVRVIEVPTNADAEIGDWVLPFEFTVGDPPPPKPLVELVTTEQAPLLADCYLRLSTLADSFTSEAHFWANTDALLNAKGVLGHGATEAVKARLTPWDKATLGGTLTAISKEFGEPPVVVPPVDPNVKITAVTYVYEKDDTAVPVGVSTGLNRLNREKNIRATLFEEDTVDGDGDVPDQYRAALTAATEAGLPALVSLSGDKVLQVVKDPRTEAQVWGIAP